MPAQGNNFLVNSCVFQDVLIPIELKCTLMEVPLPS